MDHCIPTPCGQPTPWTNISMETMWEGDLSVGGGAGPQVKHSGTKD